MARLLILRHGKTELISSSGRDFDRTLVDRGKRNSAEVAQYIKDHLTIPDKILVSPASRTMETMRCLVAGWEESPEVIVDKRIYSATGDQLLEVIKDHGGDAEAVMVIGHNPGLIILIHLLTAEGGNLTRVELGEFPTAALADMLFDLETFDHLELESGKLLSLLRPKDLIKTIREE